MNKQRPTSSFSEHSRDTRGFTDLHFGNLFDQDETVTGDLIDPATGKRYDNSSHSVEDIGLHIDDGEPTGENDPPEVLEFVDKWLEKQDEKARRAMGKAGLTKRPRNHGRTA